MRMPYPPHTPKASVAEALVPSPKGPAFPFRDPQTPRRPTINTHLTILPTPGVTIA